MLKLIKKDYNKSVFNAFTLSLFGLIPLISILVSHQIFSESIYILITYIKVILLLLSSVFILFYLKPLKFFPLSNKLIVSMFLYLFVVVLLNFEKTENYFRVFKLLFSYILFFNYGYILKRFFDEKIFLYLHLGFCLLFVFLVDPLSLKLRTIHIIYANSHYSDYSMWAFSVAFTSLLSMFSLKRYRYISIIVTIFILACLNSRSVFVFYFLSVITSFLFEKNFKSLITSIGVIAGLCCFSLNQYFYQRYSAILNGTSDSLNQRLAQFYHGFNDILESPIKGNFLGQLGMKSSLFEGGDFGNYMHSYISFWRQYGVYSFVILNFIFISFFLYIKGRSNFRPLFMGCVFTFLMALFSRSFLFSEVFIWAGVLFAINGSKLDEP